MSKDEWLTPKDIVNHYSGIVSELVIRIAIEAGTLPATNFGTADAPDWRVSQADLFAFDRQRQEDFWEETLKEILHKNSMHV